MVRKRQIIYDTSLEVPKREFFVSTKIGKPISELKKRINALPSAVKWLVTLMVGACISAIVGTAMTIYLNIGFTTVEEISNALKVQFIIDVVIVALLVVFIGLVIKEANS